MPHYNPPLPGLSTSSSIGSGSSSSGITICGANKKRRRGPRASPPPPAQLSPRNDGGMTVAFSSPSSSSPLAAQQAQTHKEDRCTNCAHRITRRADSNKTNIKSCFPDEFDDDEEEEEKEEIEDEEENEVRRPVFTAPRQQRLTAGLSLPLVTKKQPLHLGEGRQREDEEEEEEEEEEVENGEEEEDESIITDTEILAATTAARQQSALRALRRRRAVNGNGNGSNSSNLSFGATSIITSTRGGAPTTMPYKRHPSSSLHLPHALPVRNSRLNSHSVPSSSSSASSSMPNPGPFPSSLYTSKVVSVRPKQRGRGRWWVLRWWPFPSFSSWDMRKWVVPQDSAFKRGWDMLTVVLATVVLCSDAASLIQQQHNPSSSPSSSSSSSPSSLPSNDNNIGNSSNPSSSSSSFSSTLDPSSLYHLLLLEAIWFLVDLALTFRTEVEIVLDDDDAAAAAVATGHETGRQIGGRGGGGGAAAAAAAAAAVAVESETETILLLRDPHAIAIQYLSRDFWLDLCFSFPWLAIAALLLTPKRKKRNAVRRALGHVGRGVGGFLGRFKRGVGSKIPRFLRPDNVRRFFAWTRLLEVKKVDGVKHVVKYRKEYRGLRLCIRGMKWLCRFPVASFIWRVYRKLEAHLVVAVEEGGGDDGEEERKGSVWRAGQARRGGMALSPSLFMAEEERDDEEAAESVSFYDGEEGERGREEAERW